MQFARLKIDDREIELSKPVMSVGRALDNDISFPGDSNISRSHAEIEYRDGLYFLIDPGSSNGTTVNDEPVTGEVELRDGDKIVFGNSAAGEFLMSASASDSLPAADDAGSNGSPFSDAAGQIGRQGDYAIDQGIYEAGSGLRANIAGNAAGSAASSAGSAGSASAAAAPAEAAAGGSNATVLTAGIVGGLAVVALVGAGAFYLTRGASSCGATAKIRNPEQGETITKPTDIDLEINDSDGCVAHAVLLVDKKPVTRADPPDFTAKLDPQDLPEMSDGDLHDLSVVLYDKDGGDAPQSGSVMLAFDSRAVAKPRDDTKPPTTAATPVAPPATTAKVSLLDVQKMSAALVKEFSGGLAYDLSDRQFLTEVQKRTAEYAVPGYTEKAAKYRDAINVAFTHEQNLDAPLGFILAMSRSRFEPAKKGDLAGLWQMNETFVVDNKYNGSCGTESIADPSQNCASKAAALYMKALVFGVFDGDPLYSAAAFGKPPAEAAQWKTAFTADRSKIWVNIKTAPEREQLVRFFAAGIVAQNPQRFGLATERPLSDLYRVTM